MRNDVRCADRVLVIENGSIAEEGSPAELHAAGGLYAALMLRRSVQDDRRAPVGAGDGEPAQAHTVSEIIHRLEAEGSPSVRPGPPHEHVLHVNGQPPQKAGVPARRPSPAMEDQET